MGMAPAMTTLRGPAEGISSGTARTLFASHDSAPGHNRVSPWRHLFGTRPTGYFLCPRGLRLLSDTGTPQGRATAFAATMGEAVGLGELDIAAPVHPHDAGEPRLGSDPIDGCLQDARAWGV